MTHKRDLYQPQKKATHAFAALSNVAEQAARTLSNFMCTHKAQLQVCIFLLEFVKFSKFRAPPGA